jgi:aspartate kinase
MAEQRPDGLGADRYELALIVARSAGPRALAALELARGAVGCGAARCEAGVGRLLLLGADLRSRPEVTARLLAALDDAGVRFEFVSAAADRVCLVIRAADAARAGRGA